MQYKVAILILPLIVAARLGSARTLPPADVEAKVDALLGRMTIEEKLGQLQQLGTDLRSGHLLDGQRDLIRKGRIGSLLNVRGSRLANEVQHVAVEEWLSRVPILFGFDVVHGHRTVFPISLAGASTWDPAAVERASRAAASRGGQCTPEVGGDIRRRGLRHRTPRAVAAEAEAVGRQPALLGHRLERPPGVAGVPAQDLPIRGDQAGSTGQSGGRGLDQRGERAGRGSRGPGSRAAHGRILSMGHLRGSERGDGRDVAKASCNSDSSIHVRHRRPTGSPLFEAEP
jgi:hypothetical protein